jgi:hypothetical protein
MVECPNWDPKPECGNGLHGLAWGDGDWCLLSDADDAVWMVVRVASEDVVKIDDSKVKFRRGFVEYAGARGEAIDTILCGAEAMSAAQQAARAWGATSGGYSTSASSGHSSKAASSGDSSTAASSGHSSKAASSGDSSKAASSGDYSTAASSGHSSTAASSGHSSTAASSGDSSKAASSGHYSKAASSGHSSTAASSGDSSKAASSGYSSKAVTSGHSSTAASSGHSGIAATIGHNGHAKAGPNGLVIVTYWVEAERRYRACVGNVGEGGILPDTWYCVVDGKLTVAP